MTSDRDLTGAGAGAGDRHAAGSQWELAHHPSARVRAAVARGARGSAVVRKLSEDPVVEVRSAVAGNASTPVDVLWRLADDASEAVRAGVARNPAAPAYLLEELVEDRGAGVRAGVAANPAAGDLLGRLVYDPSEEVRRAVAGNPAVGPDLLEAMADYDPRPELRKLARRVRAERARASGRKDPPAP